MAIWNLGSINADHFYRLDHIPAPGETIAARETLRSLGGKGANMSIACARAGAQVHHIGAVGADGLWAKEQISADGVDVTAVHELDVPTGHAVIALAQDGENAIILSPGANRAISEADIERALGKAKQGDWFVTQNETNGQVKAASVAKARGLKIAYAAAPFDAVSVDAVLPFADLLILNEIEMAQLTEATGLEADQISPEIVIVTKGGEGAELYHKGERTVFDAIPSEVKDTTGAGDTFTGYVLAGLDAGLSVDASMTQAAHAGALMVARVGTADVIPTHEEVSAAMGG